VKQRRRHFELRCEWPQDLSCNVEESFKKFLDPNSEADDCQNLTSVSLSKDTVSTEMGDRVWVQFPVPDIYFGM